MSDLQILTKTRLKSELINKFSQLVNLTNRFTDNKHRNHVSYNQFFDQAESAIIISQENDIMKNTHQPGDDEEFQVFLSREDYEELKRCKLVAERAQEQWETRIRSVEAEKAAIQVYCETLALENQKSRTSIGQAEAKADQILTFLKQKYEELQVMCGSELTSLQTKKSKKGIQFNFNATNPQQKFNASVLCIQAAFELFSLGLQKQHEKVANLIRQTAIQKEQNGKLKEYIAVKDAMINSYESQKKIITQKHSMDLNRLQSDTKSVDQANTRLNQLTTQTQHQTHQIQALNKKISYLQNECLTLTKQNDLLSQQNVQFQNQNRQLQDQVKQYQQHISILKQSVKIQSRNKEAGKMSAKKNKAAQNNSKFEKEDYIKETLVEYVREIRKNLIKIGNLSQEEIKQIGTSELRTLVKFINELQEDFE